jgi:hypothetical protein
MHLRDELDATYDDVTRRTLFAMPGCQPGAPRHMTMGMAIPVQGLSVWHEAGAISERIHGNWY